MRYLLVNHIAAAPGSDAAHLALPPAWARDLSAAARAAAEAGIALTVATPLSTQPIPGGVEVVPDQVGFEHIALPFYDSAGGFLRERTAIQSLLRRAIGAADLVQLDHGGYPVSLGHIADPIANGLGKRTAWIVSGDSLPQSSLATSAGNVAKRLVGRSLDSRLRKLLINHLADAALVICGTPAVKSQLADDHHVSSHSVESCDVLDREVATSLQIQSRTQRLLDVSRAITFIVTGEQNIVAGTDHVLRAMHRCLRLGVACELVILGDGVERGSLLELADSLQIARFVRFSNDPGELDRADVWINPALTRAAQHPFEQPMAAGLAPILYRDRVACEYAIGVAPGSVDGLAAAMFDAAVKRDQLVSRMLSGVEHARARTLESGYRKRFALAKSIQGDCSRPAA